MVVITEDGSVFSEYIPNQSTTISTIIGTKQKRFEFVSGGTLNASTSQLPIYVGEGEQGIAEGATSWIIQQFQWDSNGNPTTLKTTTASWTARATANYT